MSLFANLKQSAQGGKKPSLILISAIVLLIFIVLILTIVIVTSGGGADDEEEKEPQTVELTFWGRSVDENVMEDIIEEFESENPYIKVKYSKQTETGYKDRVLGRLKTGNPTQIPDIMEVSEYWLDEIGPSKINPITDSNIKGRFASQPLQNNTNTSLLLGVPFRHDSLVLIYNRDHLDEIGLRESEIVELSWSSLLEQSKKLTETKTVIDSDTNQEVKEITRGGVAIGAPQNTRYSADILNLLLLQNQVEVYDSTKRTFELDEEFEEVVRFYAGFEIEGVWDSSMKQDIDAFEDEDASMIVGTIAEVEELRKSSPQIDFGVVFPSKIAARKDISLSTSLIMPNAKVAFSTQANKFIEFLTRTEQMTQIFERNTSVRFIPSQTESLTSIPSESVFAAFADIVPVAEKINTPDYESMRDIYNDFLHEFYEENFILARREPNYNNLNIESSSTESKLRDLVKIEIPTPTE